MTSRTQGDDELDRYGGSPERVRDLVRANKQLFREMAELGARRDELQREVERLQRGCDQATKTAARTRGRLKAARSTARQMDRAGRKCALEIRKQQARADRAERERDDLDRALMVSRHTRQTDIEIRNVFRASLCDAAGMLPHVTDDRLVQEVRRLKESESAALVASASTGCLTGDCPHDNAGECIAPVREHVEAMGREMEGLRRLADRAEKMFAEIERDDAAVAAVVREDQPWPLSSVLLELMRAADVLLDDGYDAHGWEIIDHARAAAREILAALDKLGAGPQRDTEKGGAAAPFSEDALDPGIRETVAWLRSHGFRTTDSGDGSKTGSMECAAPFPHVFMTVDRDRAFGEAQRLHRLVNDPEWRVELTYSPADGACVLALYADADATESEAAPPATASGEETP